MFALISIDIAEGNLSSLSLCSALLFLKEGSINSKATEIVLELLSAFLGLRCTASFGLRICNKRPTDEPDYRRIFFSDKSGFFVIGIRGISHD